MPHESTDSPRGKFRAHLRSLDIAYLNGADPRRDGSASKQPWRAVVYDEVVQERIEETRDPREGEVPATPQTDDEIAKLPVLDMDEFDREHSA